MGGYGVNAYDVRKVEKCLTHNSNEGFLNIVAVHAGKEHVNYPSIEHIRAARQLAKKADYVYYGHHPHVIQGVEEYGGSLIAHSLGNFCFDDIYTKASGSKPLITLSDNNRHGAILELTVEGNKVNEWREQVVFISKGDKMELLDSYDVLAEYNDTLTNCENNITNYCSKRNTFLSARIAERKDARTLTWYIKRLKPMYLKLLLNSKNNSKKYKINVLNNIKDD